MTPQDCDLLIDRLTMLAEYYEKPKSEAQLAIYVQALADLPIAEVLNATSELVKTSVFYPKVSEIRAVVEGDSLEHAERAWSALLREIRAVGYTGTPELTETTRQTVNSIWGNWENLCRTLPGEGKELLGWAKQFKSTYCLFGKREFRNFLSGESRGLLGE